MVSLNPCPQLALPFEVPMKLWGMAEAPGWIPPTEMLVVPWPKSPQCRSSLLREGKAQFTPCCVPPPIHHKLGSPQG